MATKEIKKLSIPVSPAMARAIEERAREEDRSVAAVLRRLMVEYLDKEPA